MIIIKDNRTISFSNAILSIDEENGDIIITEITKDDSIETNLSDILRSLDGSEGVSITIKKNNL